MAERMDLTRTAPGAWAGFLAVYKAIRDSPLDRTVEELVKIRVSQLNGCAYCVDLHIRDARRLGEPEERMHHLTVWPKSPLYSEAERAALAYAEAVTRREPVDDDLWETLGKHFEEEALGNLVALVSLINAMNLFGVPLNKRPPAPGD
ncbi:carboxymuconolactone decarboxylase family protein [Actinomadura viridis]|uniref:carboxymuconolactone decarboxylase family protein n=1 Tax=Actinomadura viridis TaxID=58110 RepID=UPI0036973A6A